MGLSGGPEDDTTSDARRLWDDAPASPRSQSAGPVHQPTPGPMESIELAPVDRPPVRPVAPASYDDEPSARRSRLAPDRSGRIESARDFPLWSRGKENGPVLFRVALVAGLTLILAWIFADWNTIHVAGWIALLGAIGSILLAYPLVVGLERPVRSSPERVVRDFLESLEHHLPLYRRMWLLLTPEGQSTVHYTEAFGFRTYWAGRIREWRHRGGAWGGTPVVMTIDALRSTVDPADPLIRHLSFDLAVSLRGRRSAGPVARYKMNWTAERGRDGQWYLRQANPPG